MFISPNYCISLTYFKAWRLPSILTLIAQVSQVGSILVFPLLKYYMAKQIKYKNVIYTKLILETSLFCGLVFYWNKKVFIIGENRSVALYFFNFMFSLFGKILNLLHGNVYTHKLIFLYKTGHLTVLLLESYFKSININNSFQNAIKTQSFA